MDILDILMEAKAPSKPKKHEVEKDKQTTVELDDAAPDIGISEEEENGEGNDEPREDPDVPDDGTSPDETSEDVTSDDPDNDPQPEDALSDDGDTSTDDDPAGDGDDTSGDGTDDMGGDATGDQTDSDTSTDDSSDGEDANKQNSLGLLNDLISMYNSIKNSINKMDQLSGIEPIKTQIINRVKTNLNVLLNNLYMFITTKYAKNSYVQNLYLYTYFIEGYKINVEMLKKIGSLAPNK